MATCTITVIPPPPPPPVEKKIILELTELEASALRHLLGKQVSNPSSYAGQAISAIFTALYDKGIRPMGRVDFGTTSFKLFD